MLQDKTYLLIIATLAAAARIKKSPDVAAGVRISVRISPVIRADSLFLATPKYFDSKKFM
jgi:hypothetical protein